MEKEEELLIEMRWLGEDDEDERQLSTHMHSSSCSLLKNWKEEEEKEKRSEEGRFLPTEKEMEGKSKRKVWLAGFIGIFWFGLHASPPIWT